MKDFSTKVTAIKANMSKDITEGIRKIIEAEVGERLSAIKQR